MPKITIMTDKPLAKLTGEQTEAILKHLGMEGHPDISFEYLKESLSPCTSYFGMLKETLKSADAVVGDFPFWFCIRMTSSLLEYKDDLPIHEKMLKNILIPIPETVGLKHAFINLNGDTIC